MGADCCKIERKQNPGAKLNYDPNFTGPLRWSTRVPTDIYCIILFCFYWVGMAVVAFYALVEGNPNRLLYPVDSQGRLCGVDTGVESKPNLFFFDLTTCANIYRAVSLSPNPTSPNFSIDTTSLFSCPTPQVCVETCPNVTTVGIMANPICIDGVDTTRYASLASLLSSGIPNINNVPLAADLLNEIVEGRCAPYYVVSTEILQRCIPTIISANEAADTFLDFNSNVSDYTLDSSVTVGEIVDGTIAIALIVSFRQLVIDIFRDLTIVWPALLVGLVLAALVPFIYILLLRWLAWIILIAGIIVAYAILAGISGFSFWQFYRFETNTTQSDIVSNAVAQVFYEFLPWYRYQRETWLAIGIIFAVVLLILSCILIFLIPRIIFAIRIIVQASKAVGSLWSSLFYPFVTWILLVILAIYYVVIAVFLVTATEKQYSIVTNISIPEASRTFTDFAGQPITYNDNELCDINEFLALNGNITIVVTFTNTTTNITEVGTLSCTFLRFFTSNELIAGQFYHLFGFFWGANYIVALGECALAGGFAAWYWAPKINGNRKVPWFPVFKGALVAFIYHSGSLAFGALIIAIIQMIQVILGYIQKQLTKRKELKVIKIILKVLSCLFFILEKILRYINRMAYIEIAIYGYGFCKAAYKAVKLLLRNIIRAAVKDSIAHFLLFTGKIACVGIVAIFAYLFFGEYNSTLGASLWGRPLNFYLVPVIVLVFATYLIASGFLSTYSMAIDTLFICVLEDLERNDGSPGRENRFDENMGKVYLKKESEEDDEGKKKKKKAKNEVEPSEK